MSYQEIIKTTKPELEKTLDFFKRELAKIRTGQASPALIEDVLVEVYGQSMALKQVAGISLPERRQLVVQPWDHAVLPALEKALQKSSLGASPVVEGDLIRITLPPLTQEYRQSLGKLLSEKTEQAKETLRKWRDEAWGEIQEEARKGEIREDDKFKGKEELQKVMDEYAKKIDEAVHQKRNEIEL